MAKYRHRVFEMYEYRAETIRALTPKSAQDATESPVHDSTTFEHVVVSYSAGVTHVQFKAGASGEETATNFRGDLARLAESLDRNSKVVLDLAGVDSLSDASIAALAQFQQQLKNKGSRMALCCLEPAVRESFFAQ